VIKRYFRRWKRFSTLIEKFRKLSQKVSDLFVKICPPFVLCHSFQPDMDNIFRGIFFRAQFKGLILSSVKAILKS